MTRESFIAIIHALELQSELDYLHSRHISALAPESIPSVYTTKLNEDITKILTEEFDDKGEWISFYLYELDKESDKPQAWHRNGSPIKLDDAGDLYDLLIGDTK